MNNDKGSGKVNTSINILEIICRQKVFLDSDTSKKKRLSYLSRCIFMR